jgi:hypothetical protein
LEIALSRNSGCLRVVEIEIETIGVLVFITTNRSGRSTVLPKGGAIHATNQATKRLASVLVGDVHVPAGT